MHLRHRVYDKGRAERTALLSQAIFLLWFGCLRKIIYLMQILECAMLTFSSHVDGYYDVSDQLIDYLRRRAEKCFEEQERRRKVDSISDFEENRRDVRDRFLDAIGGLPDKKTPLNAQCTGKIDRGSHTIEKIVYQSLPEFYVTAALYVPKGLGEPNPAVLFLCGHSDSGKAYPVYQAVCVDLVTNGFVVLAMDPPGQGERWQYLDPVNGVRIVGGCTTEHTHAGLQFVACGASLARHFIWDGIRAVDYLTERREVDPDRIGVTGNSGGGTQTCYLMLCEPRLAAAVPCTFPMTLRHYHKTGQPQDSEQIVYKCFVRGPEHVDYITGLAPKPVMIGAAAYDYFPIEGTLETYARARSVYRLYGAEEKISMTVSPSTHAYSPVLRQAAVNWFKIHLKGEPSSFVTGQPETLPEEELYCTAEGQILRTYRESKTVHDLVIDYLKKHNVGSLSAKDIRERIMNVLGIDGDRSKPIYPRMIQDTHAEGYRVEKIFFFSEDNIVVTGVMIHPRPSKEAKLTEMVLLGNGTRDIPLEKERLERRLRRNHRLFIFDVRGTGAVESRPINSFGQTHDSEYRLACDAFMMGISTLGLRVFDVLRGYDYLKSRDDIEKIGIYGVGSGAIISYFAATLEEGFQELTFEDMLYSYRNFVETKFYSRKTCNPKILLWGILEKFDVVDVLPCLSPRKTFFINPRDACGETLAPELFEEKILKKAAEKGYLKDWKPQLLH